MATWELLIPSPEKNQFVFLLRVPGGSETRRHWQYATGKTGEKNGNYGKGSEESLFLHSCQGQVGAVCAAGAAGSRLVGNQRIAPKKQSQLGQAHPEPQQGSGRRKRTLCCKLQWRGTAEENLGWICCMGKDLTYALCCPVWLVLEKFEWRNYQKNTYTGTLTCQMKTQKNPKLLQQ